MFQWNLFDIFDPLKTRRFAKPILSRDSFGNFSRASLVLESKLAGYNIEEKNLLKPFYFKQSREHGIVLHIM